MNSVLKFYQYLGVSDTNINGEQLFNLLCLLGNENIQIELKPNPLEMCNSILDIFIQGMETNSFKHITEDQIIKVLNKLV